MLNVSVVLKDIDSPMGKYLICKKEHDGKWMLPSGTSRTNEERSDAVVRLMWEQLGVEVTAGKLQMHARRKIPDHFIVCEYYDAVLKWKDEPKTGCYCQYKWVRPNELGSYEFEEFDARFMSKFIPWINADGTVIPGTKMF